MAELRVQDVTLGYEGRPVVEGLSFTVGSGDYLYILGENGSGKSTLIKAILGLHPAMKGEIRWEGLKPSEIGYLPQQTDVQRDFPASVIEIVPSGSTQSASTPASESTSARPSSYGVRNSVVDKKSASAESFVQTVTARRYSDGMSVSGSMM